MGKGRHEGSILRDYLRVVRRRKWLIAGALILVPLAAVAFSLHQPKKYEASAEVLLSRQNLVAQLTGAQDPTAAVQSDRIAQTQADLARVPDVALRTIRAANVGGRTPQQLLDSSSVVTKTNSDLLQFNVTDTDPRIASRFATVYAQEFTNYRRNFDTAELERARKDFQARIQELERAGHQSSPLYTSLVGKEEQLATIEALQTSNAYLVRAAGKAVQVQPRPVRNGLLGLALGLILGLGLAFLWEALDTRVRSVEEVIERLRLPLLARLPSPTRRLQKGGQLTMLADPSGRGSDAYRVLRTNLEFALLDRNCKTIMVSSSAEGEGKSTTVANLAVALARAGKRVVLVDLDLRRPRISRFFDLPGFPGLTDVALGHASLKEALESIALSQPAAPERAANGKRKANGKGARRIEGVLEVLPTGPLPPDPGEFATTQALGRLLDQLSERADVVLIDAPPLLHVGDAIALSAKVDALILVARLNVVRRPLLSELHRALESVPAEKLGLIATGADTPEAYGYYGSHAYRATPERARETVA